MNFQSPQVLSDLYRDLRDRRLLPVIGVLLAAMAVVPIALSKSPQDHAAAPVPSSEAVQARSSSVPAKQVVLSTPGLRDYRKRLKGRSPTDPFMPLAGAGGSGSVSDPGAPVPGANAPLVSGATGQSAQLTPEGQDALAAQNSGSSGSSVTSAGSTTPSSSGGTTMSTPGQGQAKYYTYRVKVRTGQLGAGDMKVHESVDTLAPLPSKAVPALTFLGVTVDRSLNAKRAFFVVSEAASSISGDGACEVGTSENCQMLALKAGQVEDIVWIDGATYRVRLLDFVLTDKPISASKRHSRDNRKRH